MSSYQMLYHKSVTLRAGEKVKIFFGEFLPFSKAQIRIDLESTAPKTITVAAVNSTQVDKHFMKHVLAGKTRTEFGFEGGGELAAFDELDVSVPEDTRFHIGVYLNC